MLPEPGMSCSVCHLHLMFYLEMYERNKMMKIISAILNMLENIRQLQ